MCVSHRSVLQFIGEAYLLLFQRVNDDLQKSQHLMDSQSVSAVNGSILAEVERANAAVTGQRRFLEQPYFSFLHDLLSRVPVEKRRPAYRRDHWTAVAAAAAAAPKDGKEKEKEGGTFFLFLFVWEFTCL